MTLFFQVQLKLATVPETTAASEENKIESK